MYKIKNNRILIGGASVSLPEGLYITTIDKFKESLVFTDTNKSFYIVLTSSKILCDLKSVILSEMKSSGITSIVEVTPFSHNGMSGFYAIFKNGSIECYKALLKKGTCFSDECLEVSIISNEENTQVDTIMKKAEIKTLFCDIREE